MNGDSFERKRDDDDDHGTPFFFNSSLSDYRTKYVQLVDMYYAYTCIDMYKKKGVQNNAG